jgi:hypothetical protein
VGVFLFGFWLFCVLAFWRRCGAHRARAATGHRQGPYIEQPSPDTVGVFLFGFWLFSFLAFLALLRRASRASGNRSPPVTLYRELLDR